MNIFFLAVSVNIKARTGDAVHVRELAMNLAKLGHHVSLVAGYNSKQSDELESLEKHPNIELSYNKIFFKIAFPRLRDLSSLWICLKVARGIHQDVIYERNFSPKIGAILSRILQKPLVVEINGIVEDEAKLQGTYIKHKPAETIRKKFRQLFLKSANKIVAVTPGIKEELSKRYNIPSDKIVVIPNGANTELFRPMDQNTVKKELGLNQKSKYVCFVGNLAPWQGVEYLVKAAPIVLEKVHEAMFLIVGDGMMRSVLGKLVEELDLDEKFVFTGSISYEDVPKYINASNICVAPSANDTRNKKTGGSSLKVFEYLACGKPVVTGDIKGDKDLIFESNAGYVVPPEYPIEFANAIIKLLENKELSEQLGENGREAVIKKQSWASVAKRVAVVCEKETFMIQRDTPEHENNKVFSYQIRQRRNK